MATSVEQVTYNAPDGATIGKGATEKISFYGATPVVQYPSVGTASTYATYQQSTASASTWGFASQGDLTSFILQVSTITAALRTVGLIT